MTKRKKDGPGELEELSSWASRIVIGGVAVVVIVGGLVGLAFCTLNGTPAG